ncbi:MAG: sigma-54-dependent Fis family transcriptional regulator [Acidobacteria bacterium]|nr:sigma-54-dependent Fis family transcriptional regulator [Acidobacteriota bacterium]
MSATASRARLLVVDDDPAVLPIIERFAQALGFDVHYRDNGREAIAALEELEPDVALVDLQMPELNGLDVLHAMRAADSDCQVILMTGNATVDTAVQAVQGGALDYLEKPFDFDRLRRLLVGVREGIDRREALLQADARVAKRVEFHGLIGRSAEMQQLFDAIQRYAPHVRTVLVTGETGTGKELVAKALHAEGRRPARRFLTVNCSAVVETLFESELFGHVRGAFTGASDTKVGVFEHADGGTLFLDEVGELPLALQPKLLRAVENGEVQRVGSLDSRKVDVSVIAATNRDLKADADAGRFRSDLYYRLSIIEIHLPPLRDRREDIPYLMAAFVREFASRIGRPITGVTTAAERILQHAPWPGNVRELRNVIERACILSDGRMLTERDLATAMAACGRTLDAPPPGLPFGDHADQVDPSLLSTAQDEQIRRVLHDSKGNKAAAARRLGISRRSLYRWIERLHLKH